MNLQIRRHSTTAHAAYADLVSLLLDDMMAGIKGTPTARKRGERRYWYDRYRIGDDVQERYLGEDTPALRTRIDRYEALKGERNDRRRERARLVRLLRGERFLGMDNATGSLVGALAKAGVFRLGGVLVGTNAFRMYEGELGIRLGLDQTAMTNDVDIASFEKLSLALGETVLPSMEEVFGDFEFSPVASPNKGKVWRWRQSKSQTLVEFLTPSFSEDEELRELVAFGVSAQSLHFLNYLIAEPIAAAGVYRDGILVHIPRPEKFAIHKLIVADRRIDGPDSIKARKDLVQAELLLAVLAEDRPTDLLEAYEDALSRGSKWEERLKRSLKRSPKAANLLDAIR
ncbi:nucleotidyltransferase family protein [Mesorhizobium marinum]